MIDAYIWHYGESWIQFCQTLETAKEFQAWCDGNSWGSSQFGGDGHGYGTYEEYLEYINEYNDDHADPKDKLVAKPKPQKESANV